MVRKKSVWLVLLMLSAAAFVFANGQQQGSSGSASAAQSQYPARHVTMYVPFPSGGTLDLAARALVSSFKEQTGQNLVIEDVPGGAGIPGTMDMVKAKPDGYTLGMIPSGQLNLRPLLQKTPYAFPKDFTPIIGVANFEMVFVAKDSAPYNNIKQLVQYFKKRDQPPTIADSGVNTAADLVAVELSRAAQMPIHRLPFKGNPRAVTAVLGGNADVAAVNLSNVVSLVQAGKIKILGVPGPTAYSNLPNVTTLQSQGFDVMGAVDFYVMGPKGLPSAIVEKLHTVFSNALKSAQFTSFAKKVNLEVTPLSPSEISADVVSGEKVFQSIIGGSKK